MNEIELLQEVNTVLQEYLIHLQDPIDVTRYMQLMLDVSVRIAELSSPRGETE